MADYTYLLRLDEPGRKALNWVCKIRQQCMADVLRELILRERDRIEKKS